MKKNSLTSNSGLSLSQAQSISNLCNQRAHEIDTIFAVVNNSSKTVNVEKQNQIIVEAHPLPTNVVELLNEKSKLHACQAFLMENIKAKSNLLNQWRNRGADVSEVVYPLKGVFVNPNDGSLNKVEEDFGWEQLSVAENNEFLEVEAYAAHIGQFIHNGGILDNLRKNLPKIPAVEWMELKVGEKTPINIIKHHTSYELMKYHEELAAIHREKEQRVNYFKAKVKNLVTLENARIAKHNADLQNAAQKKNNEVQLAYETAMRTANEVANTIHTEFEKTRQVEIGKIAGMRINIDARFQETIDGFLKKLPATQE